MTQTPRPLVLAVSSDSPATNAGVLALLEPYSERVVVEQTGAVWLAPSSGVDVLLVDAVDHLDCLGSLAPVVDAASAPVLVFASVTGEQQVVAAQGARGVLSRTSTAEEIVAAVEAVAAGQEWRSAEVRPSGDRSGLTARESEVLRLIVAGLSNRDIALRLDLSLNSVRSYLRSVYDKLGLTTRSEAVLWALEHPLGVIGSSVSADDHG